MLITRPDPNYEPIRYFLEQMKTHRPPSESEIATRLFKFIRNIFAHFPFFDQWNDVFINKKLANWDREGDSIDKFLLSCNDKEHVKYRIWNGEKKTMTYLEVNFPNDYKDGEDVYLKDILHEKDGVQFAFVLMKRVLMSQVETIKE
jgi:hypothetical protein